MRKHIPNIITLANLFAGCVAIAMAFEGNFTAVAVWVALAALFDFLDGVFARLLKAYSDIGKELDSWPTWSALAWLLQRHCSSCYVTTLSFPASLSRYKYIFPIWLL